jgi:hypothetical protein
LKGDPSFYFGNAPHEEQAAGFSIGAGEASDARD